MALTRQFTDMIQDRSSGKKLSDQLVDRVKKTDLDINVRDYGAKGDGTTDDTEAFKTAIALAETLLRNVRVPSGDYILNDTLTFYKSAILGDGMGKTKLIFTNMNGTKDGLVFNNNFTHNQIGAIGLSLIAKNQNGGNAIITQQNSGQNTVWRTKYVFRDLWFSGYTYPTSGTNNAYETIEAWACCLNVADAWGADIDNVHGVGNWRLDVDPSTQFQCTFIKLSAAFTLMTSRITKFTCANVYRGVDLGDKVFFQISQFDIAHAHDGIYESGLNNFDESRIFHGNINAQNKGVYLYNHKNREVHGVTVRRHRTGWKGATNDWYGFHFDGGSGIWFTNCHAQPDETDGTWSGTQIGACFTASGTNAIDNFIVGATCHEGFRFDNCTGNVVNNTVTWQGSARGTSAKLFNLINNTRSSKFGLYTSVSTFAGTVYAKDGTVGTSNLQVSTITV